MGLTLISAPAQEPISLVESKVYLRVDHDAEDRLIEHFIKCARQAVEAYTARSLMVQTWQMSVNSGYGSMISSSEYLNGIQSKGGGGIELARSPFVELMKAPLLVDEYGRREIHDYRLDTAGRVARIHFGASLAQFLSGQGHLEILFKAGYGEQPGDVPAPLRQAIIMVVADLYERRQSANDNAFIAPVLNDPVIQIIRPYRVTRML
ncbi:MAG: head-tail connector protein [Holosporales bacterium]